MANDQVDGYRAARYELLGAQVQQAKDDLHILEAKRAKFAPVEDEAPKRGRRKSTD